MNDPDAFTLREPIPAAPYLPHPATPWWIWVLAALAILAIVATVVVLVRGRKRTAQPPDPEKARRRALAALAEIDPAGAPGPLATSVSLVLRRFLADALDDPALFETHEEFLSRREALADLPAPQHDALSRLFATLIRLKYSPVPPDTDAAPLLGEARQILSNLVIPTTKKDDPEPAKQPPPLPTRLPPPRKA